MCNKIPEWNEEMTCWQNYVAYRDYCLKNEILSVGFDHYMDEQNGIFPIGDPQKFKHGES